MQIFTRSVGTRCSVGEIKLIGGSLDIHMNDSLEFL